MASDRPVQYVLDWLVYVRAAASGVPLEVKESWAVWLRDGRFVRIEQYGERTDALEAAGLSE